MRTKLTLVGLLVVALASALLGGCQAGPLVIKFRVSNPDDIDRPAEIVRVSLKLRPGALTGEAAALFAVNEVSGNEPLPVRSDYVASSLATDASGSVTHMDVLIQDDFSAGKTKSYAVTFGVASPYALDDLVLEDLGNDGMGDQLRVTSGQYTFAVGHELEKLDLAWGAELPKDLYVRLDGQGQSSRVMPLSHLYWNISEHRTELMPGDACESIFVISPGLPVSVSTEVNSLTATVRLEYDGGVQALCPPIKDGLDPAQPTDLYKAAVVLTFYRSQPRVDALTTLTLSEGFFNHNGFAMGGVETELARPRVLFGDGNHTLLQGALWRDTEEHSDLTEFMQIEDGEFVFRRANTRDAGSPFEVLSRSDTFLDYYVVEGKDGRGVFAYFPDFQRLAYQSTRNEGRETVPVNMIGAGPSVPVMVANPILISQTHLGNVGEVWAPIAPGTYVYRLNALLDVPFAAENAAQYDGMARAMAAPLVVSPDDAEGEVAVVTSTATLLAPVTSTPPPTPTITPIPTATPTPEPAACDPPRRAIPADPLPEGSLLPLLAGRLTHFDEDGALILDNRDRADYAGPKTQFFSIPGPFSLIVAYESPEGQNILMDGSMRAGVNWWDGEFLAYGGDAFILFDAQRLNEPTGDWYGFGRRNTGAATTFHFYESCGKRISVSDPDGNGVILWDSAGGQHEGLSLEEPGLNTVWQNGLFPDGVVSFELQVDPGAWIKLTRLEVVYDE